MKIGIVGYGNLGRGVESAVRRAEDMELVAGFTRRDPSSVKIHTDVPVLPYSSMGDMKDQIDVMIICGGSATDLPEMTPVIAEQFNVIDSFDTHANIPQHFENVGKAAAAAGKTGIISVGWDPGLFSLARLYFTSTLPTGNDYTFWGRGVSQGHSDAVRRIDGVKDCRQYTVPVDAAVDRVRSGENPELTTREKHTRECFVVAEEGADLAAIEEAIKTMPNYFDEYDTTVTFITEEEMAADHSELPHGGSVLRTGTTGWDNEMNDTLEFTLNLDSNPFFTGSVLTAAARAAYRLNQKGQTGCFTLLDVPPVLLSPVSPEELRAHIM